MAQGSKYTDEQKEQALAMLTTMSFKAVSESLKIPERTLRDWKDTEEKINPEFAKLRNEKKKAFVEKAWSIMEKANQLLERKLDRALNKEKELTLMLRIYQGTNIDGYLTFVGNHQWTPTYNGNYHSYYEVAKFYYHVRSEKLAYSFYSKVPYDNDKNVRRTIAIGMKKSRPELQTYVKSDEFVSKTNGIKDTPGMVFPLFDEFFGK